ncbi:MAG TPA: hypothetical protein VKB63_11305, partial [Gemmatimonadales bacterium]|nr:hypothetical protein [Gemmatimonadales bacterium]
RLITHLDPGNPLWTSRVDGIAHTLSHGGMAPAEAARAAAGVVYRQVIQQAQTLSYLDAFLVLAGIMALMVPAILLTRRPSGHVEVALE